MNRTTLSLLAAVTSLAAVTGFAALTAPDGGTATRAEAPARLPVERSSLLCPAPATSDIAETVYTSITPRSGAAGGGSSSAASSTTSTAELRPSVTTLRGEAGDADGTGEEKKDGGEKKDGEDEAGQDGSTKKSPSEKPVVALAQPGKPVGAKVSGSAAPALVGTATGALASGWTAQQTTTVSAGSGRGVLGVSCTAPDTDLWFPGASLAKDRQDYVHLTNPDDTGALVDVELYGKDGALKSSLSDGIQVPAGASVPVLLSTLTTDPAEDVTVHVTTRTGRVGAVVRGAGDETGSDWLPASADPSGTLVLPGVPADATSVRLVAFAPGDDDAELKVRLASATGTINPAGAESLRVKSGMTASLDMKDVTRGEAGSILLGPAEGAPAAPVVAALQVTRGKGDKQEIAYIPATAPVTERATAADNRAEGSVLSLTAPGGTARVKVTASAGTEGGTQAVKTYTVKGGTTLAVSPPVPAGLKGSYALIVEPQSGGPVHAARALLLPEDGIEMFTVQTLPDDRGLVEVPAARQDLSVLGD
ncbi:hypothetical protein E3E14_18045 [Streptomyces sp. ICN441]|uniref:DUF5719 family protein n=1 Tax=unclassified Streptomyces TaxID=2593676 RepID=UPI00106B9FE6|nr:MULTISPECIES: DUF5719 family protein [unclassified Streptomyces]NNJ05562.1 hypothetical protein [Streptomyces sp. PKU-MA01144]TFE48302.1 hypothetical protein E3E14_18045 [Streptomyces sp. ICN441]